jgi:hypothetical protein
MLERVRPPRQEDGTRRILPAGPEGDGAGGQAVGVGVRHDGAGVDQGAAGVEVHRRSAWRSGGAAHGAPLDLRARARPGRRPRVSDRDELRVEADLDVALQRLGHGAPRLRRLGRRAERASSTPPAVTRTRKAIVVIFQPSPTCSNVQAASVSMCGDVAPASARPADSAMEKQLACAAAISSSGLVLAPASSVRARQLTGNGPATPLASVVWPLPSVSVPSQVALARRRIAMMVPPVARRGRRRRSVSPWRAGSYGARPRQPMLQPTPGRGMKVSTAVRWGVEREFRRMSTLTIILIVLIVLAVLGYFGRGRFG